MVGKAMVELQGLVRRCRQITSQGIPDSLAEMAIPDSTPPPFPSAELRDKRERSLQSSNM